MLELFVGGFLNSRWGVFLYNRRRLLFNLAFFALPTIVYFQNCAPINHSTVATQGDLAPPDSPFKNKKVVLSRKSFSQEPGASAKTAVTDSSKPPADENNLQLKSDVRLLAKINNACAVNWCVGKKNYDAISCQAFRQRPKEKLKDTFQIYEIKNPGNLNEEQLQDWAGRNQVDQNCLIGISEMRIYKNQFNDTRYEVYQKPRMDLINFEEGQSYFQAAQLSDVKVGIIDSGVALDAVELGRVQARYNGSVFDTSTSPLFQDGDVNKPNHWHGTFVAGIIGATRDNNNGFVGIAPNVRMYSYGIGSGQGSMTNLEIGNAIQDVIIDQMDVVNMSFGNVAGYYNDDPMISDGLIAGYSANILFVVAAGNSGQNLDLQPSYPAQYSYTLQNVITVAASDQVGSIAGFSNRSSTYVNIIAPGVQIASTYPGNLPPPTGPDAVAVYDGTSFAAPMVTGAAALAIGSLKFKGLNPNTGVLKKLITVDGAGTRSDLTAYIRNGAFLDIEQLGKAVEAMANVDPITLQQERLTDTSGKPTVRLTITYDASQINAAANSRIGIFDLTSGCNYSGPCLIQSFTYPPPNAVCDGNICSFSVTLNREQVVSMMSAKTDPLQKLTLSIAVYHVVTGKNTYGVDAASQLDLRELPGNNGSPILGEVTNIRMDMQNYYIKGWVCLPGSETAVKVGLVDVEKGDSIIADFAYAYPYMVPHGSPIDGLGDYMWMDQNSFSGNTFQDDKVHSRGYMASGITVSQSRKPSFLAGLESNPQLVSVCDTLTASHGFELIVPFGQMTSDQLSGKKFQVKAGNSLDKILKDTEGAETFEFPEVTQAASEKQFSIARDDTNYQISGGLCASSPSPVEVEVSYTTFNFAWALTGIRPVLGGGDSGFVYDPLLQPTTAMPLPVEAVNHTSQTDMTLRIDSESLVATDTDPFTLTYLSYSQNPPNAAVGGPTLGGSISSNLIQTFVSNVNARNFKRVGTGESIQFYRSQNTFPAGSRWPAVESEYRTSRTGLPTQSDFMTYWDYYDVGEMFSLDLIGYNLATHYPTVAQYLRMNYQITSALREVKKFETPISKNTGILGHTKLAVNWSGNCAGGYRHDLSSDYVVENYVNYSPFYTNGASGFWRSGTGPSGFTTTSMQQAMRNLPVTLRFFQDGKLILHLESDSGSNFKEVPYNFR